MDLYEGYDEIDQGLLYLDRRDSPRQVWGKEETEGDIYTNSPEPSLRKKQPTLLRDRKILVQNPAVPPCGSSMKSFFLESFFEIMRRSWEIERLE